jgi:hypothetical protein
MIWHILLGAAGLLAAAVALVTAGHVTFRHVNRRAGR